MSDWHRRDIADGLRTLRTEMAAGVPEARCPVAVVGQDCPGMSPR